jgi:LysR family transcriptional regulator, cyn operon transcriptional activator
MPREHGTSAPVDLRHLRYFVAVAEAASVSGAAPRLRITQPALSRQIHELERQLGVRLFDRVGRRLQLSAAGEDLLARSRRLLADADAMAERAQSLSRGDAGILRVGATPQTLQSLVAGFMTRYRRRRPGVDIRLTEEGGIRLLTLVERGELHLALGAMPTDEHLSGRRLFPYRVLAVTGTTHPLARRRTIELGELVGAPLMLLRRDFGSRVTFDAACRARGLRPTVTFESGEPNSLVALAEEGHGVAVIPSTVRLAAWRVRAAAVLSRGVPLGDAVALAWDPRRVLPPYAHAFIDELVAHTRRSYPGSQFDRLAPPIVWPADPR